MVQPAYKRRAIEDSPSSEFEELEGLEIAQADKNIFVPEDKAADPTNDNMVEQSRPTLQSEKTIEVIVPVFEKPIEDDANIKSPPPSYDESLLGAPRTPQRQISSQKTSTPRSQHTPKTSNDWPVRNETHESPPPEEEIKPRMVMTRMVLNNFKSYAGRQDIGPFHKSFSAVVGPNGSGKSNVIDALLFVFGYRANKMRQGKLSELIHNSAAYPDLDMCSVEVHFQEIYDTPGSEQYTVVDNSKLIVSRQAFRNNNSKYYINSKTSTFTEVTTLLKERGIDLDHKRFLILQGEVESIALMKPKAKDDHDEGLLEYLEDIIGTTKYKDAIEKSNQELDRLNDERTEKLNRVKYVEKEKNSLEAKKIEAENYLRNENELARKKNQLYQMHLMEANENVEISKRAVADLVERMAAEESKHASIKEELKVLEDQYQQTKKDYEAADKETSAVTSKLAKFERDDVQLQEKKKHLTTKQKKLNTTLATEKHSQADAENRIKNSADEIENRKRELEELEEQLQAEEKELEKINQELKGKTDVYVQQIEEHQMALAPWTEKINEKKHAIDVKKSERDIFSERMTAGQKAVEIAEQEQSSIEESAKSKSSESKKLKTSVQDVQQELVKLEKKIQTFEPQERTIRLSLSGARQKADEARAQMQQSQSRGKVLDGLIHLRDSGDVKGIQDRLGNLGVIDDKYDVAISTACPALENIVVDNVETGQKCIEYLRKNNLGRAVFTLLDQTGNKDMGTIQTPENVPRLFDLVRPKEARFAAAFYSVMQDTLVAENVQQANRIAYGKRRWRVVTLDGKLIEKSGAMTGGGSRPQRGAMSSTFKRDDVTPEMVAKLEQERDKLDKELRAVLDKRREAEQSLNEKKEDLPRMQMDAEKLEMELKSLDKRKTETRKRLAELRANAKPNPADVKRHEQIEVELVELTAEIDHLKDQTAQLEDTIKQLHQKIMEAGGIRLRLQKVKVDGIKEQIDLMNDRITKSIVSKSKAEKDATRCAKSIVRQQQQIAEIDSQLEDLTKQIEENAKIADDIRKKAEESQNIMESKKSNLEELKEQLDTKSDIISKIRAVEMEIKNQTDDYQKALADNERKAEHWQDQISKLTLQRIWNESDEELELPDFSRDELKAMQDVKQSLKADIAELEAFVQDAKPNLSVLEEYRRREQEYTERANDLAEVTRMRDTVKAEQDNLMKARLDEFMQGFNIITQKLKEMYQMITLGGNAELELVDSLDPFSEGIVFSVMPPKKSWKNIANLSGGEKTLSSLALVFALHHFKPTPLYVMDEIDAALDFRNVSIVANYIKERTKNAQFVIISLRNNMFELADRLVGIYKTDNCTKSVAVNPNRIAMMAEAAGLA
ncbi:Structural maintenance of chromosomes protein 4 [Umbelopsis nana]